MISNILRKALLIFLTQIIFSEVFAQAPNITYQTPKTYPVNSTITPLFPTNTGGAVPATIYGEVSTYAGSGARGSADGLATAASFNSPTRVSNDAANNLFVADRDNNLIRKITPNGMVTTFAGGFNQPNGVTVDLTGNVYVADATSNSIRKITSNGLVSTFAGSGSQGNANGTGTSASFYYPYAVALDVAGNIYVADAYNNLIRKITSNGLVTTLAGSGNQGFANGNGTSASFNHPNCVAADATGNIYVADPGNNMIRKVTSAGLVTTFAGNGNPGSTNGTATSASFNSPSGIALDAAGNFYVSDLGNNLIRKIDPSGIVTTLAGSGSTGSTNGIRTLASFNHPNDVQVNPAGFLYVADFGNNLIRKILITGYTIDKTLPTGLTFDATTGIISGTATVLSPATDYTVTAYNTSGSSSTIVNISVVNSASITFAPISFKTICDVDFDPGATGGSGTITYTSNNPAVATIVAGKIHINGSGTAVITATDGITSVQQSLTVTMPVTPTVTITPGFFSSCVGMQLTYTATAINQGNNPTYQWQVNGKNVGTNSSTFVSSNLVTDDKITCTVTNNDACIVSGTSHYVTLSADAYVTPTVIIQSSAIGPVPSNTIITFTATPTIGGTNPTYQWQVNGINTGTNNPVFTGSCFSNGDQITCVLTNNGGKCLTTATATSNIVTLNIISSNQTPIVTVTASSNQVYAGTAVTFTANVVNATPVNYQWQINGNNAGTNSSTFTSTALKNGDQVTCTITTNTGCTVSVISLPLQISILKPPTVNIPNTFTPNGDGINDFWNISALTYYPRCLVNVYNRFGSLVYKSKGYSKAWDGFLNGSPLPMATYYYLIDLGTKEKTISGSITLIR